MLKVPMRKPYLPAWQVREWGWRREGGAEVRAIVARGGQRLSSGTLGLLGKMAAQGQGRVHEPWWAAKQQG